MVSDCQTAIRHRLQIGTIVGDPVVGQLSERRHLGTIEEYFIARLKPGDVFWFAGLMPEFVMLERCDRTGQKNEGTEQEPQLPGR